MEISKIKQNSNLYAIASLKFKLSLLGDISYESQKEKYGEIEENYPKLEKDKFTVRDVIGFLEHERWNAYQLSEGVLPLKKELVWTDATGNGNKTKDELYHFCITTRKGLLEYDKLYEKRFGKKSNIIEYDYAVTDRYFKLKK